MFQLSGVRLSDEAEERAFTFHLRAGDTAPYPVRLEARTVAVKQAWLEQLQQLLDEQGGRREATTPGACTKPPG